jgi:UrcA family protein
MDIRRPIRRSWLLSVTAVGAACLAATATAQIPDSNAVRSVTVQYRDLDVNTPAGATALYGRIRGAARFVCGEEGRSLDEKRQWQDCFDAALSQAVDSVHSPLLSTLGTGPAAPPTAQR